MASEALSDYERRRQENIRRNAEMLETLNLTPSHLKPRRSCKRTTPPSTSNSRRSLRIRGKSPQRFPKFPNLETLTLTLTAPSTSSRTPSVIDTNFDPRLHLALKPENSALVLPKIISSLRFLPFADRTVAVAGNAVGDLGFWVVDSSSNGSGVGVGVGLYDCCSHHSNLITGMSVHGFSPTKIYSSSYDRTVRLMDVEKENYNTVVCSSAADCFYSICQWMEDVSALYIGEGAGKLKVWDEKGGKVSSFLEIHNARINTIDFNPANANLMATSSSDGMACIWDLRFMKKDRPEWLNVVRHERAVHSAYFSPSGRFLATTSDDDKVGILSGANFGEHCVITHKNRGVKLLSSTKGIWGWSDSYLFLGNSESAIDVISIDDKRTVALKSSHMNSTPQQLAAHPNKLGSLAAATGSGKVFLWTKD